MAASPTIEIVIRDEVTVAMDRLRQRMRSESGREWFGGVSKSFVSIGNAAQRLQRELGGLARLTGVGVFLGGGFVAGLTKLTQSMGDLSRQTLQMNATSASLGITVKQFDQLIARGQAVGLTVEQAKAQIGGLGKIIDDLVQKGPQAAQFAEIYKSKGGKEILADVLRAYQRGGPAAGIEEYIRSMGQVIKRTGRNLLGDFAGLSPAWPKALEVDQKDLVEKLQIGEEAAQKLNVELVKLQITLENVKKTAAIALLPAMTELVKAFDTFVSGPGAAVVKSFGDWLASLNIDWKAVTAGIVSITEALTKFFGKEGIGPIIEQMGGWKVIIGGLVGGLGLALLVSRLGGIASGLALIGHAAWVVPLLGAVAIFGAGGAKAGGGAAGVPGLPGGPSGPAVRGPGRRPGGGATFDERFSGTPPGRSGVGSGDRPNRGQIDSAPYGRDRRGRAYPAPQSQQRSDLFDPENAAPYRVAGGWQPPPGYLKSGDTSELRDTVTTVTENITRLAQNVAALGLNTDASGAGPMAGLAGRVTSGGGGGGGGGSSGSRRRASSGGGGGGGGSGRPPAPLRVTDTRVSAADDEFRIGQGPLPSEAQLSDKSVPAGRRFNNPFNMWHDKYADQQGGVPGRKITPYDTPAIFPSGQAGAAAVIRKMMESPLYRDKTMWDLIGKWVSHGTPGGYAPWIAQQTGIPVNTRITREFLMSDDGLKFLKAMARYETKSSEEYPLTDEQWRAARDAGARIKRGQQNPPANPNVPPADPKIAPANPQPNTAGTNGDGPEFRTTRNKEVESYVGFERAIQGLSPEMHARVMAAWRDMPPDVRKTFVINEGWRTFQYQDYLRRSGRYAARPGHSRHEGGGEFGEGGAIDVDRGAALDWLHRHGHRYGLEGIGRGDYPHIQMMRGFRGRYYDPNNPQRIPLPGQPGEKARQAQAQTEFDEYLQKQQRSSDIIERARNRINLRIRVRGPRGVKVNSESDGVFAGKTEVARDIASSGLDAL